MSKYILFIELYFYSYLSSQVCTRPPCFEAFKKQLEITKNVKFSKLLATYTDLPP